MDPNISTAIALGAFFVWALVIWKRLASLKREVSAALARAEAEAQRLRDLAPRLERAAHAGLEHERETLEAVAAAHRSAQDAAGTPPDPFVDAGTLAARVDADEQLASALNRLLASVEAHQELKGDESLRQLSREFSIGEDRVSATRRSYDQAAIAYNAALQAFPAVMFAGMLGFKPAAVRQ